MSMQPSKLEIDELHDELERSAQEWIEAHAPPLLTVTEDVLQDEWHLTFRFQDGYVLQARTYAFLAKTDRFRTKKMVFRIALERWARHREMCYWGA